MVINFESLAHAIILKAVKDYRRSLRKLAECPNDINAHDKCKRIEQFFHSEYFCVLSNLDPVALLERLNREVAT